jgi:hypothetical protein
MKVKLRRDEPLSPWLAQGTFKAIVYPCKMAQRYCILLQRYTGSWFRILLEGPSTYIKVTKLTMGWWTRCKGARVFSDQATHKEFYFFDKLILSIKLSI